MFFLTVTFDAITHVKVFSLIPDDQSPPARLFSINSVVHAKC